MRNKLFLFMIVVTSLVLSVAGAAAAGTPIILDKVVAVVNDDVITWSELYRTMEMDASPQLKAMNPEQRREIFKENEVKFLESMITMRLQTQEAKKLGFRVGEDEIRDAVDSIKKKYGMTDEAFRESLRREGYTLEEYQKRMYEQILVSKLVNQQIRSKIVITDKEVRDFMAANQKSFENTDSYHVRQIFFKRPKDDAARGAVEAKADEVMSKLRDNGDFSELARQFSEDPSAPSGGDLGFIKKSDLAENFASALAGLKPGEVSRPFWTDAGLHILRLEEKSEPKTQAELLENARASFFSKIFMERYNSWVKSLREGAFIEIRE